MQYHPESSSSPPPGLAKPVPPARRPLPATFWTLLVLIALLILPYVAERVQFAITRGREQAAAEVAKAQLAGLPETSGVYRLVAKVIEPSVVGVTTTQELGRARTDEWSFFFRQFRVPHLYAKGLGSGVIVDKQGYIITNSHVINHATEVSVKLSDGRMIDNVQLIGADPLTDIAVLKIDAGGLTAAAWGDSDKLEVGDPVLAIGNPFGLAGTVTAGILSAKRDISETGFYKDFLQTDAAVNPGNSGGPLVNLKGEVVGINTAIVGEVYQGISFAIPSRIAQKVYDQLKGTGKVARGYLGVELQQLDEQLAAQLGLKEPRGALVASVLAGGPAAAAGIEPGDVIIQWGKTPINNPGDLIVAVARTDVGSKATAVLLRNGQKMEVTVTVGERPPRLR